MSRRQRSLQPDLPLTLLYGDSDELKRRAVERIVKAWLDETEREFGLVRVHADEVGLEGIIAELQSGSLMAPRRVVVVDTITALLNSQQRRLASHLEQLQPDLAVVLVAPRQDERRGFGPPVAADLRKAVEKHGQIIEVRVPTGDDLPRWVREEMHVFGKSIDHEAAAVLCETVGSNVDRLLREIEKLAIYVGEREQVTVADVAEVSTGVSEAHIFKLMDAIGDKDVAAALEMLEGVLREGADQGEFLRFIGMVSRQLRLIWQARFLRQHRVRLDDVPQDIAARLPEYQNLLDAVKGKAWLAEGLTRQAARFSDRQLARALDWVYQADLALKGKGPQLERRTVVELLVTRLCT